MDEIIKVNSAFFELLFVIEELQCNGALPYELEEVFEKLEYSVISENK